MASKIEI